MPDAAHDEYAALLDRCLIVGGELLDTFRTAPRDHRLAADFAAFSQSVRLSITLVREIKAARRPKLERDSRRAQLIRGVQDNIGWHAKGTAAAALEQELRQRLEDPALENDLAIRPVDDLILEISRDLRVPPPGDTTDHHRRRTPADIAALHALAAKPARRRRRRHTLGGSPDPKL